MISEFPFNIKLCIAMIGCSNIIGWLFASICQVVLHFVSFCLSILFLHRTTMTTAHAICVFSHAFKNNWYNNVCLLTSQSFSRLGEIVLDACKHFEYRNINRSGLVQRPPRRRRCQFKWNYALAQSSWASWLSVLRIHFTSGIQDHLAGT